VDQPSDQTNPPGQPTSPPGWYPDPVRHFEFRWFNGRGWTADVSVDGRRFVDALEQTSVAPLGTDIGYTAALAGGRPSRTLAVLAMIFGVGGLVIAWMPFLFVVGGLGAVGGIVLGIVALQRISAHRASGRRMAVSGIVAGVAALGLCVVGFLLTRTVVEEINDYTDPGPLRAAVTECTADASGLQIRGTIRNDDDHTHDYVIVIGVSDRGGRHSTSQVPVDAVAAGQQQSWSTFRATTDLDVSSVTCEVRNVDGPYPFGLDKG
jgi:hypothetical protein